MARLRPIGKFALFLASASLLPFVVEAQSPNLSSVPPAQMPTLNDPRVLGDFITNYRTAPGTCVVVFTVFGERNGRQLDRQAVLKMISRSSESAVWQTTDERALSVFTNVAYGKYDVEISAVGYLTGHAEVNAMDQMRPVQIEVVLQRDPSAVNLDVAGRIMTPKARKGARRAISMLKSGNLTGAQKQLAQAYELSPSSPELNFLLGYLYFQKRDLAQAGTYLGTATALNPGNAQALALLGRTNLERQDYPAARSALEQAVLADAENWLPHSLLADTYLHQRSYEKARYEAATAIQKGKTNAHPARLILGEALVGLGRNQEGIQALNAFIEESPRDPMANQVRTYISGIQQSSADSPPETVSIPEVRADAIEALAALPTPSLSVKPWQPPGIDEIKPAIVPGAVCPAEQVIDESGKGVEELVQDVARFAAVEDLFHQSLDRYGVPTSTQTRKYNYVASISESQPGFLNVDEYRAEKLTFQDYPDQIASVGFAALALVFHPHMRDNFEIICEGLGDWKGEATWLVHFRQRDDRPNRMHSYKLGNQTRSVALKGRAWITADKFQIVRIEAEMVKPVPEIQLLSEHQLVEYGPVPFAKRNTTLWLPKSAEIYFDFRKHRYYRRHSFDHYMLFAVDAEEKRKEPTPKPIGQN